ncbi:1-(5-phosphoribosyl)-5-[(5-phosphoribosylamino)methylideneamino] imidazole-4-carboxamide isomerase [Mycena indigotica]|uniref:1-(5-phosphoribosyl)-5-[(5-phosphoribosylamino)methylideneamino] imidazole-4-carboxamide isomerase n=1 Tax=Mycena indigotica TaxID=2126181 RepID=A0A8H6SMC2_9AGAR|nr:1-(5-phosphoribosyl)-5-[(5-phosphoribosylamino)methylideneamino] imidazole-4-carboxamide isomerase [Mycena indigotica]KAF7301673.1 1-(5-phosphoribosyl)-5-[(5-phosphoribosylamino)methylideneamino] imidazole-4-carboxamide isomerase [Mycena indigotica]
MHSELILSQGLSDFLRNQPETNAQDSQSAADFARLYREHNLVGGHVIKLGPGNDQAAREALAVWPGGLQIGGGITVENAQSWLDAGASKVIVTSYLFPGAKFSLDRLKQLSSLIGKGRLVVDVSCRRREEDWIVAMNKWQDLTDMIVSKGLLQIFWFAHCSSTLQKIWTPWLNIAGSRFQFALHPSHTHTHLSEFLIHAADVEGLCQGIDEALVQTIEDLDIVRRLSGGKVDLTYGSSLDIFGGTLVKFEELVAHQFVN